MMLSMLLDDVRPIGFEHLAFRGHNWVFFPVTLNSTSLSQISGIVLNQNKRMICFVKKSRWIFALFKFIFLRNQICLNAISVDLNKTTGDLLTALDQSRQHKIRSHFLKKFTNYGSYRGSPVQSKRKQYAIMLIMQICIKLAETNLQLLTNHIYKKRARFFVTNYWSSPGRSCQIAHESGKLLETRMHEALDNNVSIKLVKTAYLANLYFVRLLEMVRGRGQKKKKKKNTHTHTHTQKQKQKNKSKKARLWGNHFLYILNTICRRTENHWRKKLEK